MTAFVSLTVVVVDPPSLRIRLLSPDFLAPVAQRATLGSLIVEGGFTLTAYNFVANGDDVFVSVDADGLVLLSAAQTGLYLLTLIVADNHPLVDNATLKITARVSPSFELPPPTVIFTITTRAGTSPQRTTLQAVRGFAPIRYGIAGAASAFMSIDAASGELGHFGIAPSLAATITGTVFAADSSRPRLTAVVLFTVEVVEPQPLSAEIEVGALTLSVGGVASIATLSASGGYVVNDYHYGATIDGRGLSMTANIISLAGLSAGLHTIVAVVNDDHSDTQAIVFLLTASVFAARLPDTFYDGIVTLVDGASPSLSVGFGVSAVFAEVSGDPLNLIIVAADGGVSPNGGISNPAELTMEVEAIATIPFVATATADITVRLVHPAGIQWRYDGLNTVPTGISDILLGSVVRTDGLDAANAQVFLPFEQTRIIQIRNNRELWLSAPFDASQLLEFVVNVGGGKASVTITVTDDESPPIAASFIHRSNALLGGVSSPAGDIIVSGGYQPGGYSMRVLSQFDEDTSGLPDDFVPIGPFPLPPGGGVILPGGPPGGFDPIFDPIGGGNDGELVDEIFDVRIAPEVIRFGERAVLLLSAVAGEYLLTVEIDDYSPAVDATRLTLAITVVEPDVNLPLLASGAAVSVTLGAPMTILQTLNASGGGGGYRFTAGQLASYLRLSEDGYVSGTADFDTAREYLSRVRQTAQVTVVDNKQESAVLQLTSHLVFAPIVIDIDSGQLAVIVNAPLASIARINVSGGADAVVDRDYLRGFDYQLLADGGGLDFAGSYLRAALVSGGSITATIIVKNGVKTTRAGPPGKITPPPSAAAGKWPYRHKIIRQTGSIFVKLTPAYYSRRADNRRKQ